MQTDVQLFTLIRKVSEGWQCHICKDAEKQELLHIALLFSTTTSEGRLASSTKAEMSSSYIPLSISTKFIHKKNSLTYTPGMMNNNERNKLQHGPIQITLKKINGEKEQVTEGYTAGSHLHTLCKQAKQNCLSSYHPSTYHPSVVKYTYTEAINTKLQIIVFKSFEGSETLPHLPQFHWFWWKPDSWVRDNGLYSSCHSKQHEHPHVCLTSSCCRVPWRWYGWAQKAAHVPTVGCKTEEEPRA